LPQIGEQQKESGPQAALFAWSAVAQTATALAVSAYSSIWSKFM
jgi:heme exporter protein D